MESTEQQDNTQVVDKVVTKPTTRQCKYFINYDDRLQLGDRFAEAEQTLQILDRELSGIKDSFKAKIKAAEAVITSCASIIRNGYETKELECEITLDYDKGMVFITRRDTGEVVENRSMTAEEQQMKLFESSIEGIQGGENLDEPATEKPEETEPEEGPVTGSPDPEEGILPVAVMFNVIWKPKGAKGDKKAVIQSKYALMPGDRISPLTLPEGDLPENELVFWPLSTWNEEKAVNKFGKAVVDLWNQHEKLAAEKTLLAYRESELKTFVRVDMLNPADAPEESQPEEGPIEGAETAPHDSKQSGDTDESPGEVPEEKAVEEAGSVMFNVLWKPVGTDNKAATVQRRYDIKPGQVVQTFDFPEGKDAPGPILFTGDAESFGKAVCDVWNMQQESRAGDGKKAPPDKLREFAFVEVIGEAATPDERQAEHSSQG
ncbi:MAG: hypothetical protein FVQ81_01915 [Candidatus Glassbacteria bacterium]|nr:hypothetical protein [Candidatus Glassbacteria bacterium]